MSDAPTGPDRSTKTGTADAATTLRIEIAGRTIWQVIGSILATLLLLRVATAIGSLLGMLALSLFFSLALEPAVQWLLARHGWRRGAAVGIIYLGGVLFVAGMVFVMVPALGALADTISSRGGDWIADLNSWAQDTVGFPVTSRSIGPEVSNAGQALGGFSGEVFGTTLGIASAGVGLAFNLATMAMFTFYFTADAPRIKAATLRLFSPRSQERIGWIWDQAIVQTGGYFYSRMILMAVNGVGFFATMVIVGLPVSLALPLALFGGFVSVFIPAVGTYIGAAIPVLLTLAIQGLAAGLAVLVYAVVYQQIENYWLSPKISANTMSLNGGVAFGAALAGGAIAGPIGAFVALPVAALLSSVIANYARSYEVVYRSPNNRRDDPPIQRRR